MKPDAKIIPFRQRHASYWEQCSGSYVKEPVNLSPSETRGDCPICGTRMRLYGYYMPNHGWRNW